MMMFPRIPCIPPTVQDDRLSLPQLPVFFALLSNYSSFCSCFVVNSETKMDKWLMVFYCLPLMFNVFPASLRCSTKEALHYTSSASCCLWSPTVSFLSFSLRISCCLIRTSPTPGSSWLILGLRIRLKQEMSSRTFLERQSLLVSVDCFFPLMIVSFWKREMFSRQRVPTGASLLNPVRGQWCSLSLHIWFELEHSSVLYSSWNSQLWATRTRGWHVVRW